MNTSASVLIGNQNYLIRIPSYDITCKQFMKYALEQSNYDRKNSPFALFEFSNGIEELISRHENISKILQRLNANNKLILRKCHSIEKNLQVKQQKPMTVKAYYKKAKVIELAKEKKIMKTETKMEPLVNKVSSAIISSNNFPNLSNLCNHHKNQLNEIISDKYKENSTFLTYLHMKLKKQNTIDKSYKDNESTDSGRHTDEAIGSKSCSRSNSHENIQYEVAYETWV